MQTVSVVVMVTTLSMVVDPPRAQAQPRARISVVPGAAQASGPSTTPRLPADRYAESLDRLKGLAAEEREHSVRRIRTSAPEEAARLEAIRKTVNELEVSEASSDESFAAVAREIEARKLGNVIRDRHLAAEREFKKRRAAMKQILGGLKTADSRGDARTREQRILELDAFLRKNSPGRKHKKLDPNRLPWRVAEKTARKPATTTRTFRAFAAPATATRALSTTAAASSPLSPTAPEYLAETDDAQLTPAVRDLAASLGGNPVRIYEWVRNNVEYFPSFGSIQGSDVTLSKRRGNAFDTASLLVAMLRGSGIPARYVYGTIEAPATAVQDWVGGVTTPSAAQQLLGQGGVPNAALITGNQITHIQVEHVWVEAWIDFAPSRGQLSRQGDTWVPLDASYKGHREIQGLADAANVQADPAAIEASYVSGATFNDAQGWVQTPNVAGLVDAVKAAANQQNAFIWQAKPNATNADAFGTREIVTRTPGVLAATLPFRQVAAGARYADLPASLTHRFRYIIWGSELDRAMGEPLLTFEETLPKLADRRITIRYEPATPADASLIAGAFPKPHADGSPVTLEELARVALPAYLVQVRPVLRVDGAVRVTGAPVQMGSTLAAAGAFTNLDLASGWDQTDDVLTAGQATALGLDIQGIGENQIQALNARLAAAKQQVEQKDTAALSGEGAAADIITLAAWAYFAEVDRGSRATEQLTRNVALPSLSYGLAHADVLVESLFGVPRTLRPSGFVLDIGHLRTIGWSRDGDATAWVRHNVLLGYYASALEHHVPEKLFTNAERPGNAASSVSVLAKATAEGQRIFTLTSANLAAALPLLSLSGEVIADIRGAIAAGKEVTVHERAVTIGGWTGAGYVVLDPATGSGAYLISGGLAGGALISPATGFLVGALSGLLSGIWLGFLVGALLTSAVIAPAFAILGIILVAMVLIASLIVAHYADKAAYECYSGGMTGGFELGMLFAPIPKGPKDAATLSRMANAIPIIFDKLFVRDSPLVDCL